MWVRAVVSVAALLPFTIGAGMAAEQYVPASMTAERLFELNRKAAGGVQRGSYRTVEETRSPTGDVWTVETLWSGRDFRSTIRLAGFVSSYGSYGGQEWNEDANGLVMESTSGFQMMDPYASALQAPDVKSNGVSMLGMTVTEPKEFVVQVAPNGGLLQRQYYDAKTYLLVRRDETDYDGHHQVWQYDDFRPTNGMMLPHVVRYLQDGSTVTRQTQLVSFERLTAPPDLLIPPGRPLFSLGTSSPIVVPATFTSDGIFVPVIVNGSQMDFQLDSGSSDFVIDPGAAKDLGMSSSGATRLSYGGDFTVANTRAASLRVGPLYASNVAMSTIGIDLNFPGRRVRGLLGTDFIGAGATEVNFQKNTLTIYPTLPDGLANEGWFSLPLRLDSGVPMIKATFSGLDGEFIVDLGAFSTMLYPHYFTRYAKQIPTGTPDYGQAETIARHPFGFKSVAMRSMVLGDWVFGNVQAVVPSAQYAQDRDYDGLIGRDTLSNFDIMFDYAHGRVWLRPFDVK